MLELFGQWVAVSLLRMPQGQVWTATVEFFIADVIKIIILLLVMVFVIGFLRTFVPHRQIRIWMRSGWSGYFFAALFGAVTPFCSCSSIPIFFAFLKAGVPLGVMFSFLITSPVINEYVVVLMAGFFGWKIAVAYVISGIMIGVFSGIVLGRMKLERYLADDFAGGTNDEPVFPDFPTFFSRIQFGWREALDTTAKIWVWILVGVGVGALIHNHVPQDMIRAMISVTGAFSVPVAALLGVPLYGSCAAVVPIAVELFAKGVPLGTSLAFLMGVAALSLPEAIMLRRAMKLPLILIFFGVTTVAIIFTGYMFNILQGVLF